MDPGKDAGPIWPELASDNNEYRARLDQYNPLPYYPLPALEVCERMKETRFTARVIPVLRKYSVRRYTASFSRRYS